ncbi:MAG: FmdB family zinc ribbon protein [Planctomycetota bacterium]
MPLYEFVCQDCQCEQELLLRGEEMPLCESCGGDNLDKLLSVPAAHSGKTAPEGPPPGFCGSGCGCFPN